MPPPKVNFPGAARANPDGHTLYVGYTSETVIVPPALLSTTTD